MKTEISKNTYFKNTNRSTPAVFFIVTDRYHNKVACKKAFSFILTHKHKKETTIVLEKEVVLHC